MNESKTSYRDQELVLIEVFLSKHAKIIDSITAIRLIRYLSEIMFNRGLLFDVLCACTSNSEILTEGRATFSLYLLNNYQQDFNLYIKENDDVWSKLLFDINKKVPFQLLRIHTYLDKNNATKLFNKLLIYPEYQDSLTDILSEWLHDNRLNNIQFKNWLTQLVNRTRQDLNAFNRKVLDKELSKLGEQPEESDSYGTIKFSNLKSLFDCIDPMQNYRENQINPIKDAA